MVSREVRYGGSDVVAAGETASTTLGRLDRSFAGGRFGRVTCRETQSRGIWYGKEWRGKPAAYSNSLFGSNEGKGRDGPAHRTKPRASDMSRDGTVGEERGGGFGGWEPKRKSPGELDQKPHGSPALKVSLA